MAELLRLIVWTPSETVVDAQGVEWVHVKLAGSKALTIWPGHAPLLGETGPQAVRYADPAGTHTVDLPSGIVRVQDDTVTLFLAGILGEEAWPREEGGARFERLAETMLGALETRTSKRPKSLPGKESPEAGLLDRSGHGRP